MRYSLIAYQWIVQNTRETSPVNRNSKDVKALTVQQLLLMDAKAAYDHSSKNGRGTVAYGEENQTPGDVYIADGVYSYVLNVMDTAGARIPGVVISPICL